MPKEIQCSVIDTAVTMSTRTRTAEGYLQAPGILARTGVQYYAAYELGLDQMPKSKFYKQPNRIVALYRPAEEVFEPESMASFDRQPITMDHPPSVGGMPPVHAGNWKQLAVGDAVGIRKAEDGVHLAADIMTIRDKAAVAAVDSGKKALSNGYAFRLDMTSGTAPDGTVYDGIQRKIRGNHIAIVDAARGGERCNIGDAEVFANSHRRKTMEHELVTVVMDNMPVQIEKSSAVAVNALIARDAANALKLKRTIRLVKVGDKKTMKDSDDKDEEDDTAEAGDADKVQTCIDGLRARCSRLRKRILSEDALTKLVETRMKTVAGAKVLAPTIATDGKPIADIQREVLTTLIAKDGAHKAHILSVLDGADLKTADAALLQTAFNVVSTTATTTSASASDRAVATALVSGEKKVLAADAKPVGRAAFLANQSQEKK